MVIYALLEIRDNKSNPLEPLNLKKYNNIPTTLHKLKVIIHKIYKLNLKLSNNKAKLLITCTYAVI